MSQTLKRKKLKGTSVFSFTADGKQTTTVGILLGCSVRHRDSHDPQSLNKNTPYFSALLQSLLPSSGMQSLNGLNQIALQLHWPSQRVDHTASFLESAISLPCSVLLSAGVSWLHTCRHTRKHLAGEGIPEYHWLDLSPHLSQRKAEGLPLLTWAHLFPSLPFILAFSFGSWLQEQDSLPLHLMVYFIIMSNGFRY